MPKGISEYNTTMNITEIYNSICGEGIESGRPAVFVRGMGCNLRCKGCDTSYAFKEGKKMKLRDILFEIRKKEMFLEEKYTRTACKLIFLTGGEITIQSELKNLVSMLKRHKFEIILQTNGTNYRREIFEMCDLVSSDVKTPCFAEESNFKVIKRMVVEIPEKLQLKFVIKNRRDIDYTENFLKRLKIGNPKALNIVLQSFNEKLDGSIEINRYRWLVETMLGPRKDSYINNFSVRYLPRLQILLWGNRRGT